MIDGWRKVWGQGDFPFLFVQIAPHNGMSPEIREAQRLTTETTPNTAMAVTDRRRRRRRYPSPGRSNRSASGSRSGCPGTGLRRTDRILRPDARRMTIAGNRAILTFKHLGGGLVAKGRRAEGLCDRRRRRQVRTGQGHDRRRHGRRLQRRRGRPGIGSLWLGERAGRQSVQQGRFAGVAVSDRTGLRAGARLRAAAQRQGSDRLALRRRRRSTAKPSQRRPLHGPRRPDRRQPGQGVGPVADRARVSARLPSQAANSAPA